MSDVEYNMTGDCNICIGPGAGMNITDESYQFVFAVSWNGPEYRTEMTPEEYEVVSRVVKHALENEIKRNVTWLKHTK